MNGGFRRSRYRSDKFEAISEEAKRDGATQEATKAIVDQADRSIAKSDKELDDWFKRAKEYNPCGG